MKKAIISILLIIIALVLVHIIRNYTILTKIQNNSSKYTDNDNYHMRIISNRDDGTLLTTNYYKKGNKKVVFIERELNNEKSKISIYDDGNTHHMYTESNDAKVANLDSGFIEVQLTNITETDSFIQKVIASFCSNIRTINENGEKYYSIANFVSPNVLSSPAQVIHVDTETGLVITMIEEDSIVKREYEFDNVEDIVFIEPNISEYEIIK